MLRRALIQWIVTAWALLQAAPAFSHSFGEPYKLPMPYWMYIYGAMAALVLSFVVLAYFYRANDKPGDIKTIGIAYPGVQTLQQKLHVSSCLKVLLLFFFLLSVVTGFVGNRDSYRNFNMTFFWVTFALGACYLTALFGDWYRFLNPWLTLSKVCDRLYRRFSAGRFAYPEQLAYWPAVALYMGFICLELFGDTKPFSLSVALCLYTALNLFAVWLVGAQHWFRYGELFSVMFRLIAMMAPIQFNPEQEGLRKVELRWPFAGLIGQRVEHKSLLVFLLFMLSSTAYDGLRETSLWFGLFWKDPTGIVEALAGKHPLYAYVQLRPWYIGFEIVCLLLSPFLYLALFRMFLKLGKVLTKSQLSVTELSLRFGYSLLPIALVYHITHYYTLLLSQGLKVRGLISDPFGWGWDIFGTAISGRLPILPDMGFVWDSQVWLILIGHVASVYLAHIEALKSFNSAREASLSQLPMLILMVLFTGAGLWILAQPLQG